MEKVEETSKSPTQNGSQKISCDNRKKSQDNDNTTSENTPKSSKINIIKIIMNKQSLDEQNKKNEEEKSSKPLNSSIDRLQICSEFNNNKDTLINDKMNEFYRIKMQVPTSSPAPMFGLMKKDSSTGEYQFGIDNTPNLFAPNEEKIGLCSNHFKASQFNRFVPDDSDLEEENNQRIDVPAFNLTIKDNSFEIDEDLDE